MSLNFYLVRCAQARLRAAEKNLHLVAGLDQLHVNVRNDLAMGCSDLHLVRIWWRSFCIERCAHHAARGVESRDA